MHLFTYYLGVLHFQARVYDALDQTAISSLVAQQASYQHYSCLIKLTKDGRQIKKQLSSQ